MVTSHGSPKNWKILIENERVFHKHRRSNKWKELDNIFKKQAKLAKQDFYKRMVADLKEKNPKQWYTTVKKLASYEDKSQETKVEGINHLSNQEQCDVIANEFSKIPNKYNPPHTKDIKIPTFEVDDIPQFTAAQVWKKIDTMNQKYQARRVMFQQNFSIYVLHI